jgi:serine/threonine protein phosphatase PrpC
MQSKKLNIGTSGATAVAVLLESSQAPSMTAGTKTEQRKLYVGNLGDSRAVLVSSRHPDQDAAEMPESGYIATRLTFDHRADDPEEQQRIKVAGGFVTRNRVLGILAVSRSFGDHGMKDFVIGKHTTWRHISALSSVQCPPTGVLLHFVLPA